MESRLCLSSVSGFLHLSWITDSKSVIVARVVPYGTAFRSTLTLVNTPKTPRQTPAEAPAPQEVPAAASVPAEARPPQEVAAAPFVPVAPVSSVADQGNDADFTSPSAASPEKTAAPKYSGTFNGRRLYSTTIIYAESLAMAVPVRIASAPHKLAAAFFQSRVESVGEQAVSAVLIQLPAVTQIPRLYHLRWPMLNQFDVIGRFIEESTILGKNPSTTPIRRATIVTTTMLAVDALLIGYCYRDCFANLFRKRNLPRKEVL
jgi:hypothetical protein